ncbi:MAG: glucose-1-phosphate cytidylyltransferase [Candidatus Xenobiia bacterium LiM19]
MKAVILAGGFGTRISEESHLRPKAMVEIGEKPILWHILKIYSHYGFNDFIVCLGYKGYYIKDYFAHYFMHESDVTFDFRSNAEKIVYHKHTSEKWCVTLVDTGLHTLTGGRIKRIQSYVGNETFMFTYGDGVSDIDIPELLAFHKSHKKLLTVTGVMPRGRFGILDTDKDGILRTFEEKPRSDNTWINGGFMVAEPGLFDYLTEDSGYFETEPMQKLLKDGQVAVYKHNGFWFCMDSIRDKESLESQWHSGAPPWKVW